MLNYYIGIVIGLVGLAIIARRCLNYNKRLPGLYSTNLIGANINLFIYVNHSMKLRFTKRQIY